MADGNEIQRRKPGSVGVVLVAAGRGVRAGEANGPKQYRDLAGRPVIAHALGSFLDHPAIGPLVVVVHPDDRLQARDAVGDAAARLAFVDGGATRQLSVLAGLRALKDRGCDTVLIHDAARPFADRALLDRVIGAVDAEAGAIPALAVVDTLKRGAGGHIAATVARDGLFAAQTPQGFPLAAILAAHEAAAASGRADFTDDASIAEAHGLPVRLVEGSPANVKLTLPGDFTMAERRLAPSLPDVRTGNGYDVHAFEPGDHVTLCGVEIAHGRRLSGHSDADVGLHALTDALLATCGAGDIGTHFPPSDPRWKGAASRIFVEHAAGLVRSRGGRIANADITLICEAPKIGPHRPAMVAALAAMLGIGAERISVKATTNEGLGFIGREEGIAAIATASVVYPGGLPE